MAKISISEDLILSIANRNISNYVKNINETVNSLLASAIDSLSSQISYISLDNAILQPVNELFNDSMTDNSSFIYVLGVENAQLDLNTARKTRFWPALKTRFKLAWQNRKLFKKKRRRSKKRAAEEPTLNIRFDPGKYNVYSLTEDLQKSMCNYLSPTSIVYQGNNRLEIVGKEDLGPNVKVVIHVVSLVNNDFKYYSGKKKNSFISLALSERLSKLKAKKKSAGKNFTKMLKVFNALYFNINGHMPNQLFLESVLYSCPDDLFVGDFYKAFLKIINYISIKSIRNINSILDDELKIFEDKRCGDSGIGFNKMLTSIIVQEDCA